MSLRLCRTIPALSTWSAASLPR